MFDEDTERQDVLAGEVDLSETYVLDETVPSDDVNRGDGIETDGGYDDPLLPGVDYGQEVDRRLDELAEDVDRGYDDRLF